MADQEAVAMLLAALACGERLAAERARNNVALAPDERAKKEQEDMASREERNSELVEARLAEVGTPDMALRFRPFFELFHQRTKPGDWVEAQTFHYVGDALTSEFAEEMVSKLDPISAEVVKTLGDREQQETFALDELKKAMDEDPRVRERIAHYSRRISGEALTQTSRALDQASQLRELMGGVAGEKKLLLELLERHRVRLDRLGIDLVDDAEDD
ncbi:MAG: ferritin-like fold-containing protein [Actinomycetota bacterium]